MTRRIVYLGFLALMAAHKHVPSREELGEAVAALEASVAGLRVQLANDPRLAAVADRLAALEKQIAELHAAPPAEDATAAKLAELESALEELRQDAVTRADLKKFVRKPDEKEFKSRVAQELELRGSFTDLRAGWIAQDVFDLSQLGRDPTLSVFGKGILLAVGQLGAQLVANDEKARARMLFRLYWEANRFLSDKTYLFVNAEPELGLFVFEPDMDRVLIPRDAAHPRDKLGLIFKKAAAGVQVGRFGLQAGVLQFTYGAGFFVNPTNVFTPKNPLDPRREVDGVPAVKMDLALVQNEGVSLNAQVAAVGRMPRNDVLGVRKDKLQLGALGMLKLDTHPISVTGLVIDEAPDELGRDSSLSFGGIVSATPFGLTASIESLWSEAPFDRGYQPELVASLQGFTSKIGANGTNYILEYVFFGDLPGSAADAGADLARAVRAGDSFFVLDRLTRPLGRRHYANLYLEPSLTQRLRINLAGLMGFDEAVGALLRGGFDYDLYNFTVHAYGGVLLGAEGSEFDHHFVSSFAELALFAGF